MQFTHIFCSMDSLAFSSGIPSVFSTNRPGILRASCTESILLVAAISTTFSGLVCSSENRIRKKLMLRITNHSNIHTMFNLFSSSSPPPPPLILSFLSVTDQALATKITTFQTEMSFLRYTYHLYNCQALRPSCSSCLLKYLALPAWEPDTRCPPGTRRMGPDSETVGRTSLTKHGKQL